MYLHPDQKMETMVKRLVPVIFLIVLCLFHQMLWLKFGIDIAQNTIKNTEVIECCCEPDNCSCEGHENTCGTMITECFEPGNSPLYAVSSERIKIIPVEVAFIEIKTKKTFVSKERPVSHFIQSNYSLLFIQDIFRPPEV